mgnify:CR=1 FL=1
MSIVDDGSVLIVGAGASVDFWMPLGGQLVTDVADLIDGNLAFPGNEKRGFAGIHFEELVSSIVQSHDASSFLVRPLKAALSAKHSPLAFAERSAPAVEDVKQLYALSDRLRNQTAETIDAFIAENPSFGDLTKLVVGAIMVSRAYELRGRVAVLRQMAARHVNCDARNWVHLLINICRHGLPLDRVVSRKVRIINFNYDPFLEHVLREQWNNTEKQLWDWDTLFEIVHPHGRFPDFPVSVPDNGLGDLALKCGEAICVVNEENTPAQINAARETVQEWITEAKRIYAVGFAFARPNCKLLGLDRIAVSDPPNEIRMTKIVFSNYAGDVGVKLAAERYKVGRDDDVRQRVSVKEVAGTPDRPLTVSAFIKAGYLGDLPG